jgi:hypothetical protein
VIVLLSAVDGKVAHASYINFLATIQKMLQSLEELSRDAALV